MKILSCLLAFLCIGVAGLPASTKLIEGFIVEVTDGAVVVEATDHYGKDKTVAKRTWKADANDVYALDNRLVPRAMALKVGRKVYIWGKKGGAFYAVVSEGATHVVGTVKAVADGDVTVAIPLGDGAVERAFPLGAANAPAVGTAIDLWPARGCRVEALTAAARAACLPTGEEPQVAEGHVNAGEITTGKIAITTLDGEARDLAIDSRVSRGLLFEGRPGTDLQAELPPGTRVSWMGRPKGKKDQFIAAIGPDAGRIEGTVKAVEGAKLTITLAAPTGGGKTVDLPADAAVAIDGAEAKAADLKAGMSVTVFLPRDAVIAAQK